MAIARGMGALLVIDNGLTLMTNDKALQMWLRRALSSSIAQSGGLRTEALKSE